MLKIKGTSFYTELRFIFKRLFSKVLEIPDPKNTEENKSFIQTNWFSFIRTIPNEGIIQARFDPFLKPYLLQLKDRFISYHLKNIVKLKSSYSIRLYELLKQYERLGSRTFGLQELKAILAIEAEQYEKYGHFKSRVLLPSQKEISYKTDLTFQIKEIKQGRKVSKINFHLNKRNILSHNQQEDINILSKLIPPQENNKNKIKSLIVRYYKKYGKKYIQCNIEYTNKKKPKKYLEYLSKSLQSDWGFSEHSELQPTQNVREDFSFHEDQKIEQYIKEHKEELQKAALKKMNVNIHLEDEVYKLTIQGIIYRLAAESIYNNS